MSAGPKSPMKCQIKAQVIAGPILYGLWRNKISLARHLSWHYFRVVFDEGQMRIVRGTDIERVREIHR